MAHGADRSGVLRWPTYPPPQSSDFGTANNLAAALNSEVTLTNTFAFPTITFQLTIPTGATVVFEGSCDGGTTYFPTTMRAFSSDGFATSSTMSGGYTGSIIGLTHWRIRVSIAGAAAGTIIGRTCVSVGTLEGIENPPPSVFSLNVARGRIQGMTPVNKFGRNPDVDIGTEDVWSQGGTWVPPTVARLHNFTSSSPNDTAAGTGLRTLLVTGLLSTYVETTETITLNGVGAVATVNAYIFISRIRGLTAGSGGTNAGTILATAQTDGTVSMVIGKGQSQLAIYQVPAGYTAYMSQWWVSMQGAANARVDAELFDKPLGGIYNLKSSSAMQPGGSTQSTIVFDPPRAIAEKSIIKVSATSSANDSEVDAGFDLILVAT